MADTVYNAFAEPPIRATWLNDVNNAIYRGRNPNFATTTNVVNDYTLVLPQLTSSYSGPTVGDSFVFSANANNTGATNLYLNAGGNIFGPYAVTINGTAIGSGTLTTGTVYQVYFNGTGFSLPSVNTSGFFNSPAFTGTPTAPTPISSDNSTLLATTAFVKAQSSTSIYATQARLIKSGSNLLLTRSGGNMLTINGANYVIPAAGVSLAATGLTPSTLYYIYAYMVTTTMTLEASTTTHATDATTGLEIKTGDATRTLVGMARPITGPAWQDSLTQRFVVSWYNRKRLSTNNAFTANRTTTSTSFAEVNTEIRTEYLTWGDTAVFAEFTGQVSVGVAESVVMAVGIDGTSVFSAGVLKSFASDFSNTPVAISDSRVLTEGYHYNTFIAKSLGGTTATFFVGNNAQGTIQNTVEG